MPPDPSPLEERLADLLCSTQEWCDGTCPQVETTAVIHGHHVRTILTALPAYGLRLVPATEPDPGLRAAARTVVKAYDESDKPDMDHWMAFDDVIDELRAALAAPAPDPGLRAADVAWVHRLRDTTLYQCGHWLGGERICLLPHGHEKHDALEDSDAT